MLLTVFSFMLNLGAAHAIDDLMTPDGTSIGEAPKAPERPRPPKPLVPARPRPAAPPALTPHQTPPVASPSPPPSPTPPARPACSSRVDDVRAMVAEVLGTNVFDVVWREDRPKMFTSAGRFIVKVKDGGVRINMINGSRRSVGTAPATFCLKRRGGQPYLHVGLERSALRFGGNAFVDYDAEVNDMLAQLENPNELPLIVSKAATPGKIHIADGMTGKEINGEFTNEGAAR